MDSGHRGNKIGEDLVNLALGIAKNEICPLVGCRFVVVDAKRASVAFYDKKLGFTAENNARDQPVMFIDLHKSS